MVSLQGQVTLAKKASAPEIVVEEPNEEDAEDDDNADGGQPEFHYQDEEAEEQEEEDNEYPEEQNDAASVASELSLKTGRKSVKTAGGGSRRGSTQKGGGSRLKKLTSKGLIESNSKSKLSQRSMSRQFKQSNLDIPDDSHSKNDEQEGSGGSNRAKTASQFTNRVLKERLSSQELTAPPVDEPHIASSTVVLQPKIAEKPMTIVTGARDMSCSPIVVEVSTSDKVMVPGTSETQFFFQQHAQFKVT